jgi:lysyl endopeptidase
MKYIFSLLIALGSIMLSCAQVSIGGLPYTIRNEYLPNESIPLFVTPTLEMDVIKIEDEKDERESIPPRFGYKHQVAIDLSTHGVWTNLPNGDKLWRLELYCPNAKSINLTFDKFWLPEGAVFHIYGKDKKHIIGGFTSLNNKGSREKLRGFATGLVYNERVVLEYMQPQNVEDGIISISGIVHGYQYIAAMHEKLSSSIPKDFGDSGSCNVNVNCVPEGDNWQDEKTGVALILIDGLRLCTGSLMNNTSNDGQLLFLTADHCTQGLDVPDDTNADDWSFIWNYEAPNCANPITEPAQFTTNGATLLANLDVTDFALFELTESPYQLNPSQEVFFNGWDRNISPTGGGICIHHPNADIKKISTFNNSPNQGAHFLSVHWIATVNGDGVTEPGSSGSPLFLNNGLIIGQLFGGPSSCDASEEDRRDDFGRLSVSWNSNTNANRQLAAWLDPIATGVVQHNGGYLEQCPNFVTINTPIANNTIVEAAISIEGSSIIQSTSTTQFLAGENITLLPEFTTAAGSDFTAAIEPCLPRVIPTALTGGSEERNQNKDSFSSLTVFPNPSVGLVNIIFFIPNDEVVQLFVTDMAGRKYAMYEQQHQGGVSYNTNLDMSEFANGTYFITLITSNYLCFGNIGCCL